jgi:hypothetical protein
MMSYIKRQQLKIVEQMFEQDALSPKDFEMIVSPQLFNITDLPVLLELLYEGYFPNLSNLTSLDDINQSLIYLSQYSRLPYFMPKSILQTL